MYRVRTYEEPQATLDALPVEALAGYVGVLDVLELTPWNGDPLSKDNLDGNVRTLVFGPGGEGIVTYLVLEDQQRVDVLQVQWAG
ncbi:MAG: hypothetical protein M3R09_02670 [Actinomycetota bacterium]|nr:hypothetical protein [Actinomycetota bacterium]